jgi:antitoxin-like ribbon-helix-helix protein
MKQQKRSLTEALQAVAMRQPNVIAAPVARRSTSRSNPEGEIGQKPPSVVYARAGKRLIGGHFDKSVSRQLREMAAREDSTVQALLAEAMNMLFAARELPQIAEP